MKSIVEVRDISKKYRISHLPVSYLSFRERILQVFSFRRQSMEDFWALRDVSFEVGRGESMGIIGRNGAGKSTLLKILSRITRPAMGRITLRGRVASLLEVGTGFHPELTGRENIFFNGSLLGMKRRETIGKFDEIVDFSGTEKFLDTPLKHYSSGMQLRLAFSVAAFLEPEILIVDEVLAVGDAEFQKKCLRKMEHVTHSGRTVVFVSHNMAAVENLCKRAVLLDQGKVLLVDEVHRVIQRYQSTFADSMAHQWEASHAGTTPVFLSKASITLQGSQPVHRLLVDCEMVSNSMHKDVFLAFDISNSMGVTICQAIPNLAPFIKYAPAGQTVSIEIDLPPLIPDSYKVSVWIGTHNTETMVWEREILGFEILESPMVGRNFPHSHHNGFLVPHSRIVNG